jgi:hypothetical protein
VGQCRRPVPADGQQEPQDVADEHADRPRVHTAREDWFLLKDAGVTHKTLKNSRTASVAGGFIKP